MIRADKSDMPKSNELHNFDLLRMQEDRGDRSSSSEDGEENDQFEKQAELYVPKSKLMNCERPSRKNVKTMMRTILNGLLTTQGSLTIL